jgi:hypothetical protein
MKIWPGVPEFLEHIGDLGGLAGEPPEEEERGNDCIGELDDEVLDYVEGKGSQSGVLRVLIDEELWDDLEMYPGRNH